jgi:anti-sigma B factor antagonist
MLLDDSVERIDEATAVATITGRMTLGMRLREIESKLNQLVDGGVRTLVIEMHGIDYADSAGLGLIMLLYGKMKTVKGSLRIVNPSPTVAQLFELTNTNQILSIYPDRAAALVA